MTAEEILDKIVELIEPICEINNFTIARNYRMITASGGVVYIDLLLKDHNKPLLMFDVRPDMQLGVETKIDEMRKRSLHHQMDLYNVVTGVLTNGTDYLFANISNNGKCKYKIYKVTDFKRVIFNLRTYKLNTIDIDDLRLGFVAKLRTLNSVSYDIIEKLESFVGEYEINNNSFSLTASKEIELIDTLVGDIGDEHLCRYITASSLFRILNDEEDSMCGLAVMNDKSECFYLDKILKSDSNVKMSSKSDQEIDDLNRFFINSLCRESSEDKLTMWRLYGGDGKGVCIEYEVVPDKIVPGTNFYLMEVNYTDFDGSKSLALKTIRTLQKLTRIRGYKFVFTQSEIWKHFFKPKAFDVEKEVRLLYYKPESLAESIAKEKWIYNNDYQITHPIIVFKRNASSIYPLKMTKIILGPKFPEIDTNIAQFKKLLRNKGLADVDVVPSSIDIYR